MALLLPLALLAPVPWLASVAVQEKEEGLLHMQRVAGVGPLAQVLSHLCAGSIAMLVLVVLLWVGAALLEAGFAGALVPFWSRTDASILAPMLLSWCVIAASMGSTMASLLAPTRRALRRLGWLLMLANWTGCVVICTSLFGTPTSLFGHAGLGDTLPPGEYVRVYCVIWIIELLCDMDYRAWENRLMLDTFMKIRLYP